jgi:hypothetical protein
LASIVRWNWKSIGGRVRCASHSEREALSRASRALPAPIQGTKFLIVNNRPQIHIAIVGARETRSNQVDTEPGLAQHQALMVKAEHVDDGQICSALARGNWVSHQL